MKKNYKFLKIALLTTLSGFAQQTYCVTEFWFIDPITQVTFNTINNSLDPTDETSYHDFSQISTTVITGNTYNLSMNINTNGDYEDFVSIMFDWNKNGIFDSNEIYAIGSITDSDGTDSPLNVNVTIPTNALLGTTKFRIVNSGEDIMTDPCGFYLVGSAHDYAIEITTNTSCESVTGPAVITGPNAICPATRFDINSNLVSVLNGNYAWYSSADGVNGWTLIPGQTSFNLSYGGITSETYFKVIFTCTTTNQSLTSNILHTTIKSAADCMCDPTENTAFDCYDDDTITNVSFGTLNNSSDCSESGYTLYDYLTPAIVQKGMTYPISVTTGNGWGFENVAVFIDFNYNGVFENNEYFSVGSAPGAINTTNITIPTNSHTGIVSMRVILVASSDVTGELDLLNFACGTDEEEEYGEVEDYKIEIINDPLSTAEQVLQQIQLSPNPTTGIVSLQTKEGVYTQSISIHDTKGQLVKNLNLNETLFNLNIDLTPYPTGIYILKIETPSGIINKKIIKN